MDQQSGHRISDETIQLAQKHAQEAAQYGKTVEELGKRVGDAPGKFIEEQGIASQRKIEEGQASLNELQQTKSTEAYTEVVKDHVKAAYARVEATKEYLKRSS